MKSNILVVDDEPGFRDLLDLGLRLGGFRVQLAAGGREAIDLFKADPTGFKLVLLDIRMPGLDGPRTLAALRKINPAARCCFVSGHVSSTNRAALLELGAVHVFEKPIMSILGFVQQVRQLLV